MTRLSISLLGPLQVSLDGEPITDFTTDKARALLAYLAVEADHPHRRDALAGLLWPDQPQEKARQNLRQALSHLRQALGDVEPRGNLPYLLVSRETVQFNAASDHGLDVAAFIALAEACRTHRHVRLESCLPCLRRLEQMAELYRGDFLAQFFLSDSDVFEEWATLRREWLRRQAVETLARLADFYERRGDYERARHYAWRQVALEPWREEAHCHLMRLLALDGQRSAALAQYETCRRALANELGIEPAAGTMALYEQIKEDAGTQGQGDKEGIPVSLRHLVPPSPTSFVGREAELAEIAELLADPDCRLITLVGPGGVGKTRLALQAAAEQVGLFADGVVFVPLSAIRSPEEIVPAIAEALGFSFHGPTEPRQQLLDYLRNKEMLLALDSLEHVLTVADLLAEMLKYAPGLTLLVTSRERLALREEWVYQVEGLPYPQSAATEGWEVCGAVDLFHKRARQADRRFALAGTTAPAVARICRLVEGLPLAVELAAAWVATHSCEEIARELEHNLDILTTTMRQAPERQRSVRATLEYSWRMLAEAERDAFARLSAFRGGCQPEAAARVTGAAPATLAALVDKSLLRRDAAGRYSMHELLRQYAEEKLCAKPQMCQETRSNHIRYYAAFLEQQSERLKGPQQKQALAEIGQEIENARQAWEWAVARGDVQAVAQGLESLYQFYSVRGRFQEGIALFTQAVERWRDDPRQASVLGRMLSRQGVLLRHTGLYTQARAALEQGLEIAERLEAQAEQVFCLVNLANVARGQGEHDRVERLAQAGLTLAKQIGDDWGTTTALFLLGAIRYNAGDIDRAQALLEESLEFGRASGNPRLILSPLNMLADVACYRGDYARAQSMFEECLALSRELDDPFNTAVHLNNLGTVLHSLDRLAEARALYRESLDICRRIGDRAGQSVALSNLGEIAFAFGEHAQARRGYEEGLALGRAIQDPWTIMVCLNNLGEIACAVKDYEAARVYLAEVIQIARQTRITTMAMKALVNLAVAFARQDQPDRAAELLALARHHPASEQDLQKKAERLAAELGLTLPEVAPRPLEEVVTEVLQEMPQ